MDLFRLGLIPGHDRMSGVGSLEDAAMDISDMDVSLPEQSFSNTVTTILHRAVDRHRCLLLYSS
jgi:hypothetical protein